MDRIIDRPAVAFVASYPPRKCGIATFTYDLVQNMAQLTDKGCIRNDRLNVVAMKDIPGRYYYSSEVGLEIWDQSLEDYHCAAEFLNLSSIDVISIQHEFGIFGGKNGEYIIELYNHLHKPIVTTLHTVLDRPSLHQKKITDVILSLSAFIVVQTGKAVEILKRVYHTPVEKIAIIPHGVPDVPFCESSYPSNDFRNGERHVLMTFGLISPNKGIEYVIEALPPVVKRFPDLVYVVLGVTHPNVKRYEGERYRFFLENKVNDLGLQKHVIFYDRFVSLEKLIQFLAAADIYITPYLSKEQITSGTLAYALSCGKAIISTPYWYAKELLDGNRGALVPFENSGAIADKIIRLFNDTRLRKQMKKNAYEYGRQMIWKEVAKKYCAILERAVIEFNQMKNSVNEMFGNKKNICAMSM